MKKLSLGIPRTELRTRDIGRFHGIGDGLYVLKVTASITSGGSTMTGEHEFPNVRNSEVVNPQADLELVTKEVSETDPVTITVTASVSAQKYADALSSVSVVLDKGGAAAELLLKGAGTPIQIAKAIIDLLAAAATSFGAAVDHATLVSRRFENLTNISGVYVPETPSEFFNVQYSLKMS